MSCNSNYLHNHLEVKKVRLLVRKIVKLLKESKLEFDAIAFCGMSGATIAPIVAYRLGKPLLMVRKPKIHSGGIGNASTHHSYLTVEGDYSARTYIIIDDFISSGDTVKYILETIDRALPEPIRCLGFIATRHWSEGVQCVSQFKEGIRRNEYVSCVD